VKSVRRSPLNQIRKAQASILAVAERQSLETLGREEKTASRTLGQLKTQIEEMETKKNQLTEDANAQGEKKTEVMRPPPVLY
jgi:structural maintenance of chromosome 1